MDGLCAELLSSTGSAFDPAPAITRAITNVVCKLVFSATYEPGDAELQEVIHYNDGIVQTIARGGLVDIYPWMKVDHSPDLNPRTEEKERLHHYLQVLLEMS